MPRHLRLWSLMLLVPTLAGCATYLDLADGRVDLYGGTTIDANVAWHGMQTITDVTNGHSAKGPLAYLLVPIALVDLPFSLVADTLVLPYTGYLAAQRWVADRPAPRPANRVEKTEPANIQQAEVKPNVPGLPEG